MLKALDDFDINTITEELSEIFDSENIQEYLSRSIFVALPKKSSEN